MAAVRGFGDIQIDNRLMSATIVPLKFWNKNFNIKTKKGSRGGDIGDIVMSDLKKHKMDNVLNWKNPIDHHIDSYESFVKSDSKKSFGFK